MEKVISSTLEAVPNQSVNMDANWQVGNWQEDQSYDPARRYYNQYWSHTNSAYAAWEAKYQNSLGQSSYIEPSVDYEGSDMLSEPKIRVTKQAKPKPNQPEAPVQPLPENWRQQLVQLDQQSEKFMQKHQEHLKIVCANIPAHSLNPLEGPSGFSLLSKDSEIELINTIVSKINILKKAELKGTTNTKSKDKDRSKLEAESEAIDDDHVQQSLEPNDNPVFDYDQLPSNSMPKTEASQSSIPALHTRDLQTPLPRPATPALPSNSKPSSPQYQPTDAAGPQQPHSDDQQPEQTRHQPHTDTTRLSPQRHAADGHPPSEDTLSETLPYVLTGTCVTLCLDDEEFE